MKSTINILQKKYYFIFLLLISSLFLSCGSFSSIFGGGDSDLDDAIAQVDEALAKGRYNEALNILFDLEVENPDDPAYKRAKAKVYAARGGLSEEAYEKKLKIKSNGNVDISNTAKSFYTPFQGRSDEESSMSLADTKKALNLAIPENNDFSGLTEEEKIETGVVATSSILSATSYLTGGEDVAGMSDDEIDNSFDERYDDVEGVIGIAKDTIKETSDEIANGVMDVGVFKASLKKSSNIKKRIKRTEKISSGLSTLSNWTNETTLKGLFKTINNSDYGAYGNDAAPENKIELKTLTNFTHKAVQLEVYHSFNASGLSHSIKCSPIEDADSQGSESPCTKNESISLTGISFEYTSGSPATVTFKPQKTGIYVYKIEGNGSDVSNLESDEIFINNPQILVNAGDTEKVRFKGSPFWNLYNKAIVFDQYSDTDQTVPSLTYLWEEGYSPDAAKCSLTINNSTSLAPEFQITFLQDVDSCYVRADLSATDGTRTGKDHIYLWANNVSSDLIQLDFDSEEPIDPIMAGLNVFVDILPYEFSYLSSDDLTCVDSYLFGFTYKIILTNPAGETEYLAGSASSSELYLNNAGSVSSVSSPDPEGLSEDFDLNFDEDGYYKIKVLVENQHEISGLDDPIRDCAIFTGVSEEILDTYGETKETKFYYEQTFQVGEVSAAAITVSDVTGSASEAGGSASFTVVLNRQPNGTVIINLSLSDSGEGSLSSDTLTFTTSNWSTAQTVTITGINDDIVDGSQSFNILFDVDSESTDTSGFTGVSIDNVAVTNVDNDTAAFDIDEVDMLTGEDGAQATLKLRLASKPSNTVVVDIESDDEDLGTVSTDAMTFTTTNWNAYQTITITGQDNDYALGSEDYSIVISINSESTSASEYLSVDDEAVTITNVDDDTAGFTVGAISGNTSEAGAQATFTVKLNSQPDADVEISVTSSNEDEGTVSHETLTFTVDGETAWNIFQTVTVTGVDDDIADGRADYAIELAVESTDDTTGYADLVIDDVSVSNIDNDTAGITLEDTANKVTNEAGGTDTFTVELNSEPDDVVVINVESSDTGEGTVSPSSLTFTVAGGDDPWNIAQTVTVTGADDYLADGNQSYTINVSIDESETFDTTGYLDLDPETVDFTNNDNETAGFTISAISGDTTEAGGEATFTVQLTSEPIGDVVIDVASSEPTEGTASPSSLTFTVEGETAWNIPQTVTVTGVDDEDNDDDIIYSVVLTMSVLTEDLDYAELDPADVDVTNVDDEEYGTIIGTVIDSATSDPLPGVTVTDQDSLITDTTDEYGEFTLSAVPLGSRTIDFELDGYLDTSEGATVTDGGTSDLGDVSMDVEGGTVTGTVVDAVTGDPLVGVSVTDEDSLITDTTDASGEFILSDVPAGSRTIEFLLAGYSDYSTGATVTDGETTDLGGITMSESLDPGEYRIVLTWTLSRDLDFYSYTPLVETIYYGNLSGTGISLDNDDTTDGPETITISSQQEGVYGFKVNNWSADTSMCNTGAEINIYDEAGFLESIDVPTSGCVSSDYVWYAFDFDCDLFECTIDLVNTFSESL
ncbi:MAG: carboxypeptidase-like regulatory domain-containing protein [Pseudomonadota bacterium]